MKYKIGAKVYYSSDGVCMPVLASIAKVGTRWIVLDNGRRVDRDSDASGVLYECMADYEQAMYIRDCWYKFRQQVNMAWKVPIGLTVENIESVQYVLFKAKPGG